MLRIGTQIRFRIRDILVQHWDEFFEQCKEWIRPVVVDTLRKLLACRTPVLGCHHYQCPSCGHEEVVPHS